MHKIGVWLSKLWQTHVMKLISCRKVYCKRAFNKYSVRLQRKWYKQVTQYNLWASKKYHERKSKRDQVN